MASANAYLGADVDAPRRSRPAPPIVITGRVADPSLFLAPPMHEFGWSYDDWPRLARGHGVAGHLLECSAQVTGGCFADPGKKDVPDLATLGYPFADIDARRQRHASASSTGTGGRVDVATCNEQLLYEIHDPASYITPDCVLDITEVRLEQVAHGSRGGDGREGPPAHADLQGHGRILRRLHRRRAGVVRRHQRGRPRASSPPRSCRRG